MYGLELTSSPAAAVSTAEAKKHLEIATSNTDHDSHIDRLIAAATATVQSATARQLVSASYKVHVDSFADEILIPVVPLQTVTAVKYLDTSGAEQTLATSVYRVITTTEPGRVILKEGQAWPGTYTEPHSVTVELTAGYSTVPEQAKQAILLLVAHWFENREAVVTGTITAELPLAAKHLIDQLRPGDDFIGY